MKTNKSYDPLQLLSKSEAANRMGIGRKTLAGLINKGWISTISTGKRTYVIAKSILEYYDMQRPQYDSVDSFPPYIGEDTNPDEIDPMIRDIFSYNNELLEQSNDEIFEKMKGQL